MDGILGELDVTDLPTVRAVSQSCRQLEAAMVRLHPAPFQQAHVKTVEKALRLKALNVSNPRNARVLAAMTHLHLMENRRGSVSLPPRAQAALAEPVLGKVAHALPPVQSLTLGAKALGLDLYFGLLGAGLDTSKMTTLCLERCGSLNFGDLHLLSQHFFQLGQLATLIFPRSVAPRSLAEASPQATLPHYDFAPLAALSTFSWRLKSKVTLGGLDFSRNGRLRSLTVCLGPGPSMSTLPGTPTVQLRLPNAPLSILRLMPMRVLPHGGNPFAQHPWQHSLQLLSLGAIITDNTLDLSGYNALEQLSLTHDGCDLRRVRMPTLAGLTKLKVSGKHAQHLFDQVAERTFAKLTFLQLSVAAWPPESLSIPWRRMPNINRLSYNYKTQHPLEVGLLGLPRHNRISRLDLRGRYIAHRADRTLNDLPLPRLRELDVSHYRLTRSLVYELCDALTPSSAWPRFERLIIHGRTVRPDLKKMLIDLAQEHDFELISTSAL